jgi:ribosomal protein L18
MYPFDSSLLLSVHTSCTTILTSSENEEIRTVIQQSHKLAKQIKAAKRVGHKCAQRAIWIPVTRCVHSCSHLTYNNVNNKQF